MKNLTAAVIAIGIINIPTGETCYGWSIYEFPTGVVYLAGSFLLYAQPGTFEIGDKVTLRDNDSNRKLKDCVITGVCECEKDKLIAFLFANRFDYKPKRAFQKSAFSNKLMTSYSVKGIELKA